eukprot:1158666-Pelagomonas_calceolata.AAC.1
MQAQHLPAWKLDRERLHPSPHPGCIGTCFLQLQPLSAELPRRPTIALPQGCQKEFSVTWQLGLHFGAQWTAHFKHEASARPWKK